MKTFYCLVNRRNNYVFYVGLTRDLHKRLAQHKCAKTRMGEFIRSINREIEIIPLESREILKWYDSIIEFYFISYFKDWGFELYNTQTLFCKPFHQLNTEGRFDEELKNKAFHLVEKYFSLNAW